MYLVLLPYQTMLFKMPIDDIYKKDGQSPNYKGAVPYVGSSIEKMRSTAKNIETLTHSEH